MKNNAWFSLTELKCRPKIMSLDDILKNLDSFPNQKEIWFSDSYEYDKAINLIMTDRLSTMQIKCLLNIYGIHDNYAKLYPVLKHIIMTTDDEELFCSVGDIIALIEIVICSNKRLLKWLHKEIYQMFWSRLGDVKAIESPISQPLTEYALDQILDLPSLKRYNSALYQYLKELPNKEISDMPISVAFYIFDITHEYLSLRDRFEYVFCSFPTTFQLYFDSHINTVKEAETYFDLILDKDSLFFRSSAAVMRALQQLLGRRHSEEVELYILQRLVDGFTVVCEKAEIHDHDKAVTLMETACLTATQYSEPLKELGRKCWDLHPSNDFDRYKAVDALLRTAARNVNHVKDQKRWLYKTLRKHTKGAEKQLSNKRSK